MAPTRGPLRLPFVALPSPRGPQPTVDRTNSWPVTALAPLVGRTGRIPPFICQFSLAPFTTRASLLSSCGDDWVTADGRRCRPRPGDKLFAGPFAGDEHPTGMLTPSLPFVLCETKHPNPGPMPYRAHAAALRHPASRCLAPPPPHARCSGLRRSLRRRRAPNRYAHPSLPFVLCETEHPNPGYICIQI